MPHIGPGVFEVASASKGLLLEVAGMEKKEGGGEDAWSRGVQGKKGNCLACVNSRRKETSSAETLPSAREAGHFG